MDNLNYIFFEEYKIDHKKGKKMKGSYWIVFLLAIVGTLILVVFAIAALVG